MRKSFKILIIIFSMVISLFLLIAIGVGVFIHRTLERELKQDLSYFQSIKMAVTLNYDGEKEMKYKEGKSTEKYQQVSIYYPDDFKELLPLTKETLAWAMEKNNELFGTVKDVPVDLIVVQSKEELSELSELDLLSGSYSDFDKFMTVKYEAKDLILEKKETPLYFFQKPILHEYTHYVFARLVNSSSKGMAPYPVWFQEGLCDYVGNDKTIVEFSNFKFVPFADLVTQEQWQAARLQGDTDIYRQSYFAIKFLIDTYGMGVVKDIITSTNNTGDFEKSFMESTNIALVDFEKNFRAQPKQ